MGSRGARSAAGGGGGGGGMAAAGQPIGVTPPQVKAGAPAPAVTLAQLQAMDSDTFADYLDALHNTPINPNVYYNNKWATQRLIANMPDMNQAPTMVDAKTFATLSGDTLYRTVNEQTSMGGTHSNWDSQSAIDICARTMTSDVTTIGAGIMGDGFYFANTRSGSEAYGNHRNDIQRTAVMQAKLNGNARVVDHYQLSGMLARESSKVQNAVGRVGMTGEWTDSGHMAYALWKGYNVISDGSYFNVIDRRAATWSSRVTPKQ